MPHLRMFLGETLVDEVFISDVLLQSVLGNQIIAEERQKRMKTHALAITKAGKDPSFYIETIGSAINSFQPLEPRRKVS